jgi:hypothetical protein
MDFARLCVPASLRELFLLNSTVSAKDAESQRKRQSKIELLT